MSCHITMRWQRAFAAATAVLAFAALAAPVHAQTHLTTMVFQGVQNLPLLAAQEKGYFAKHGLIVDQKIAPGSQELRDGLAQGRYQIVHTSVDNAVAMAEQAKVDIVVVCGGDNGWNDLLVQPEIKTYADLRGKTVVVDAPDTAFAFQLYQMLKLNGVGLNEVTVKSVGATRFRLQAITTDKSVAASILNLPFSLQAEQAGIKKLATATDVIGPYLSTTGFVLRTWARHNGDTLVRYLQAYIEGLRWALDPANKAEATALLAARLNISTDMATRSYAVATDPANGFMKDADLDIAGFNNVLKLRAELHGDWGGKAPSPERYIDLAYHRRALNGL
jgi:ABC-type nitrate/sulfonate/bicarbonate transport system substrate-binding protein